jgi:glucose/arabinose dehydrogenase
MKANVLRRFGAACIAVLAATCSTYAATVDVSMVDNAFVPQVVTINEGDTVRWMNNGVFAHTATRTQSPEAWDSGFMNSGQAFSRTFNIQGDFDYLCALHPIEMTGTIRVTAAQNGNGGRIENPIAETIPKGDIIIELETVASGLISPLGMAEPDDGSGRVFIYDQAGLIHVLQNGTLLEQPLLDVRGRLVELGAFGPGTFDERGLLGLEVHPNFAQNRRIYTYTSEPVSGIADFTTPIPPGENFNHQSVVAEWRISSEDPNRVDISSRREVMRVDQPQFNHNAGVMRFGPDGMLYIVFGDGGAADDQGLGHVEGGNAQDKNNIYGSIIRIDVNGTNSSNGQYGIPADNPFVGIDGLDEIFAYGLRNPFSFGFDLVTGQLLLGDVGQHDIEEINIIVKGGNYGWNIKEGSFFFDPNGDENGFVTTDPVRAVPPGLIDPIAEYDHDDGIAVIGGFIYRGNTVPLLAGKYVTGDYRAPGGAANGRLFYLDGQMQLKEFQIGMDDRNLGMLLKGFGQDRTGELYVFGSSESGPFGSSGQVFKIVSPHAPLAVNQITAGENDVTVQWEGGLGPFTVQRVVKVTDELWMNVTTVTGRTAAVPRIGEQGFLRTVDQSLMPEIPLTIWLTGEAERPSPVTTTGSGFGKLSLKGDRLVFNVVYENLSGPAVAAHIHGAASVDESAGVLIDLEPFNGGGFGASGALAGGVQLDPHQLSLLLQGKTYINVHTAQNPAGEIRGQIVPVLYTVQMAGFFELPNPVESPGEGSGLLTLVDNRLTFDMTYGGLPENAVAAHFHGPANIHESAGVMIDLEPHNGQGFGRSGTFSGAVELTPDQYLALISGRTYVNVHTPSNPAGEIRGQVLPEISAAPFTAILGGAFEQPPVAGDGSGTATAALAGDTLFFEVQYKGLSGPAVGAHIHAPAGVDANAGVVIDLEPFNGGAFGQAGTLSGSVKLTREQMAWVIGERAYINIHTAANPGGEIRGQIVKVLRKTSLSGEAEVPEVKTAGDGFGLLALVRNALSFNMVFSDLTGPAMAAHIHGPAGFDEAAGVLIGLDPVNHPGSPGFGSLSGRVEAGPEHLRLLIDHRTYINVHTAAFPGGEVRGQITR